MEYSCESKYTSDCPVCEECECDDKKKVTFVETTDLIDTFELK